MATTLPASPGVDTFLLLEVVLVAGVVAVVVGAAALLCFVVAVEGVVGVVDVAAVVGTVVVVGLGVESAGALVLRLEWVVGRLLTGVTGIRVPARAELEPGAVEPAVARPGTVTCA